MPDRKNIFAIIGSASANSANEKLIGAMAGLNEARFSFTVFKSLKLLPHFDPELSTDDPPMEIVEFRDKIEKADGVIICTPEYVFSIPSGLKNAIEWCVATTVFSDKPLGIITASADGKKGHDELQMIMKTLMAKFDESTTLLIQGIKGKMSKEGRITDPKTQEAVTKFSSAFERMVAGD
jgi:chromate reductase